MNDTFAKQTALSDAKDDVMDQQSTLANTSTPSVWKTLFWQGVWKIIQPLCNSWAYVHY